MKPRVTDGLDGRSLFDVGYLGVFLEIFSSLRGFGARDNVPVFLSGSSDDVLLLVPPFFPWRKFRRKKRKVSKDRRVSFLYKYFQGNFIPWFYALASDNALRFQVWNENEFSSKFLQREKERERCMCTYTRSTYEIAFNQLFVSRVAMSHRSETRPLKLREDIAKNDANLFRGNRVFC